MNIMNTVINWLNQNPGCAAVISGIIIGVIYSISLSITTRRFRRELDEVRKESKQLARPNTTKLPIKNQGAKQ